MHLQCLELMLLTIYGKKQLQETGQTDAGTDGRQAVYTKLIYKTGIKLLIKV